MKIEAFVIHLARAEARKPQVARIIAALPVKATVVDAVDGQKLNKDELDAVYSPRLHKPYFPFEISKGEIACFLSHRKAWQMIVDSALDAGLVIEDDVEIDPVVFGAALNLTKNLVGRCCYAQFQVRMLPITGRVICESYAIKVFTPRIIPLRATFQLIDRDAAIRLLAATERFDRPVDGVTQMRWLTKVPVSVVIPSGVRELSDDLGGSTVQKVKKPLSYRMRHEFWRVIYRMQIKRYSARS
jgi:glycosyl transferase, family 25